MSRFDDEYDYEGPENEKAEGQALAILIVALSIAAVVVGYSTGLWQDLWNTPSETKVEQPTGLDAQPKPNYPDGLP